MKLTELRIEREPSYGTRPNQLLGTVSFDDTASKHTITLTAVELNGILACIAKTVADRARIQVKQIPSAFHEVSAETLLLEGDGELP